MKRVVTAAAAVRQHVNLITPEQPRQLYRSQAPYARVGEHSRRKQLKVGGPHKVSLV